MPGDIIDCIIDLQILRIFYIDHEKIIMQLESNGRCGQLKDRFRRRMIANFFAGNAREIR